MFEQIASLLSSYGFPIVACCYMGKIVYDQQKVLTEISGALREIANRIDKIEDKFDNLKSEE